MKPYLFILGPSVFLLTVVLLFSLANKQQNHTSLSYVADPRVKFDCVILYARGTRESITKRLASKHTLGCGLVGTFYLNPFQHGTHIIPREDLPNDFKYYINTNIVVNTIPSIKQIDQVQTVIHVDDVQTFDSLQQGIQREPLLFSFWNIPVIQLTIVTQNRPESLRRLLDSITRSVFIDRDVPLHIAVDRNYDDETLRIVKSYEWNHGPKTHSVRHTEGGGLIGAVVNSWTPQHENHHAILLEDDVEVSPYFYVWAKLAALIYKYCPRNSVDGLFGVSLYANQVDESKRIKEKIHPYKITHSTPYVQPLACSWGALYFADEWNAFLHYFRKRTRSNTQLAIFKRSNPMNGWKGSWKKYFMEYAAIYNKVMLYPALPNGESFSTTHVEFGEHISSLDKQKYNKEMSSVPLERGSWDPATLIITRENMVLFDLEFHATTRNEMKYKGHHALKHFLKMHMNEDN